jgi:hypothetical protein
MTEREKELLRTLEQALSYIGDLEAAIESAGDIVEDAVYESPYMEDSDFDIKAVETVFNFYKCGYKI